MSDDECILAMLIKLEEEEGMKKSRCDTRLEALGVECWILTIRPISVCDNCILYVAI